MNTSIVACGFETDIETPVLRWDQPGGLSCPNRRGRKSLNHHNKKLNDAPTRPFTEYKIRNPKAAYEELKQNVYQFVLHYDVCYNSQHCHEILQDSSFKGSHFYLDLDGTLYQTCDLYWKTNTAPADDRLGNERAVHVEMANLSWQALSSESSLYKLKQDAYEETGEGWKLRLPSSRRKQLHHRGFLPMAARSYGNRGYFSRRINGRVVRMWDFTEPQYQTLIRLCFGINRLLPRVKLKVPIDSKTGRTPLDRLKNFARFEGILGHAHVQAGKTEGVTCKYDPGSAFNWARLRRALSR
ncbi:MAG: N-acetylmuramyl-L-alanine amidase [Candidatus Nitronauta litoralis]|uniref:N-acetylmuramyl-L-alanine amidase n=1 Tax=Candidatus Nitronauta litoralis TaxID=2705533 RepID=A0A7T0G231_9BACT|nr:MAG: N-acetylmuramyl-L-alanine amidase [Candidatus Nitronauta litoralis]